jgi:hypothetical protein
VLLKFECACVQICKAKKKSVYAPVYMCMCVCVCVWREGELRIGNCEDELALFFFWLPL